LMENESDEFVDAPAKWTVVQLILAVFCTMSLTAFVKIQECFYFGSGWALTGFILFILLIGWPILYVQIRLGNQYQRGILALFEKFFPLSFGFGIAMIIRNIFSIIYVSSIMTHCLSYIFFSVYPCDSRHCVGATFMWGSCHDAWNRKIECREMLQRTQQGPTAEEGFYLYFNMDVSDDISDHWFPRWFQLDGLNIVPHLLNWTVILLTVLWGPRAFGWLLYGLAPLSLGLLLLPFGFVATSGPAYTEEMGKIWQRFYQNFAATIPLDKLNWDQYRFEPLLWGLLSTCVHLASSLHLWHGVWPSVGSWVRRGRKTMHLTFLPIVLLFGLLVNLPALLAVVCYAWAYEKEYLRCHVAHSFALPFTLIPHVLSKFSIHPAVSVCYYAGLYICLLLSQALLIVASADSITDRLRRRHRTVEERQTRVYRLIAGLACAAMLALSFPCILRSGYWWLRLYDWYMDRFMLVTIAGAGTGFFIAYYRVRTRSLVARLLYLIALGLACALSLAGYGWFAAASTSEPANSGCHYELGNGRQQPIGAGFRVIGWLIAAAPPALGIGVGLLVMTVCARADDDGEANDGGCCSADACRRLVYGDFLPGERLLARQRREQEFQLRSASGPGTVRSGLLASSGSAAATPAASTVGRGGGVGGGEEVGFTSATLQLRPFN
ncbi:hypothetical protein BOX15_Mlig011429g3, partial [Macrostomum lignano]